MSVAIWSGSLVAWERELAALKERIGPVFGRAELQVRLWCRCGPLLGACGRGGAAMSVAIWSGSLVAWERELAALKERIGPVFGRAETRETAGAFLDGLLSGVARKTGWLLAEQAGLERPYRMQSLLGRSHRDADALRDCVRADVLEAHRGWRRRAGGRRDRVSEEGRALGWGRAPVFRHGGSKTVRPACSWPMPAASGRP